MKLPKLRGPRIGRYSRPGTAPGTIHYEQDAPPAEVHVLAYGPDAVHRVPISTIDDVSQVLGKHPVVWIDVVGFGQGSELESLRELLGIHVLALEDVVNVGQRAKVEPYDDHLFIIGRMVADPPPLTEQVSLFLGDGWVLTVQERAGDPFQGIRDRIDHGRGRIRTRKADYLAYALLDAIVDSYFPFLDRIGDELEVLEEEVLESPDQRTVAAVHATRRSLVAVRKALAPHREMLNTLLRDENPLIGAETGLFLRDVYDHAIRSGELAETYREMTGDFMSTYMSAVSNRMNEVMKVLTIIATIFIPLGFIAGLYGMNFDPQISPWNMPELGWRFGYPFALGLMAAVAIGFVIFIARRGWLK